MVVAIKVFCYRAKCSPTKGFRNCSPQVPSARSTIQTHDVYMYVSVVQMLYMLGRAVCSTAMILGGSVWQSSVRFVIHPNNLKDDTGKYSNDQYVVILNSNALTRQLVLFHLAPNSSCFR